MLTFMKSADYKIIYVLTFQESADGQKAVTYSLLWWGEILVIENNTDQPGGYQRDYRLSKYLLYSRGDQLTKDCIPKKHW